jgi:hypothetical protein
MKANYTTILHDKRELLGLSLVEYCIADSIHKLSNNATHEWCEVTRENLGDFVGVSKRTAITAINKLADLGLVKLNDQGKCRTTKKWVSEVEVSGEEIAPTVVKKLHQDGEEIAPEAVKKLHHSIIISNSNKYNINSLIEGFREVNPSYERFFSNTTQRKALERLAGKLPRDQLEFLISVLPKTNKMPYCPTITTPTQLEDKAASLIAFLQKKKLEPPKGKQIV